MHFLLRLVALHRQLTPCVSESRGLVLSSSPGLYRLMDCLFGVKQLRLAREYQKVHFVPKPSPSWWEQVQKELGNIISADGVHPNEAGYEVPALMSLACSRAMH